MKSIPHLRKDGNATKLMVNGHPLLLLAGELHNSSASSLDYALPLLDKLVALKLNTVLAPLSWELVEPAEDQYDFSLVEGLIRAARERDLHLVFLWFGTLKNAMSCYVPPWVLTDLQRFPRAATTRGQSARPISVFNPEIRRCDARAFAAVMQRIAAIDGDRHTVVMMQVENETGILGAPRDCCPAADAAFAQAVPEALLCYLDEHRYDLTPELLAPWAANGWRIAGTWTEVFGPAADEAFMAWHMARFVDEVAAAGRAQYDLPMFANAWLVQAPGERPGSYPSGGPVTGMLSIWRAASPSIDLLAPDIYLADFRGVCAAYVRLGNPLLIPETRQEKSAAATALYAFGRHDAIGFSPFGIEDIPLDHPLVETYQLLRHLLPVVAAAQGTGRMTAFLQQEDSASWEATLGAVRFRARTNKPLAQCAVPGAALLIAMESDEYVVAGRNLTFTFEPTDPKLKATDLVWLDTGRFDTGRWVALRRLNGDETAHGTGVLLGDALQACRFKLHSYA